LGAAALDRLADGKRLFAVGGRVADEDGSIEAASFRRR
jgi:hypothetical protein